MLCDNCRSSNAPGAKFCAVCGEPLPEKALVHEQGQQSVREYVNSGLSYNDGFSSQKNDDSNVNYSNQNNEYYPDNSYGQNGGYGQNGSYGQNGGYGQNGSYGQYDYRYNNNQYANNQYANNQYANNQYANNQYANNQYGYNQYNGNQYGYGLQQKQTRSVGAIVFYMLSGTLALITMAMLLLPNIDRAGGVSAGASVSDRYWNVFQYIGDIFNYTGSYKTDSVIVGIVLINLFALPTFFQLLWAIFSFTRLRSAGAMGLAGSILYSASAVYWLLYLLNLIPIGRFYFTGVTRYAIDTSKYITVVPYFMVTLSIAGIVFSSIQISKRNRVR